MWPHGVVLSNLISFTQARLSHYASHTEKILVFEKHKDASANDHERKRRAGNSNIDYEFSNHSLYQRVMSS